MTGLAYNPDDWKPGDVAMMEGVGIVFRHEPLDFDEAEWMSAVDGCAYPAPDELRRLLVIDPENREQVERLSRLSEAAFCGDGMSGPDAMQAALRAMPPKPPKPDEPLGLGAVVRYDGSEWIAVGHGRWWERPPTPVNARNWHWDDFPATVEVLSEGWA